MTSAASGPIPIGILHSLTGTMAMSEAPLVDAAIMAIEEINAAGGVLGRPLEPVIRDGASDPQQFAAQAQDLIETQQVATVFGCWTSLCRKAVVPVFEAQNVLLWYPVQYEGLEQSPCVFYTGLCPNQQVEPALKWLLEQGRQRIYLVGSDYVFPRIAHKFIRGQLAKRQGFIVGEDYVPLGETDFEGVLDHILRSQPDAVFSTLNGDSNLAFYDQYQAAGITAAQIPIMAVSVAEAELQRMGTAAVGHYACWSYFQSLELPSNQAFVTRFKQRFGSDRVTSDPIEAAYTQVYLWQQAVIAAGSVATDAVRQAVYDLSWEAPGGPVYCEANHHLRKECRIGQAQSDGQFQIIYASDGLLRPFPWLGVEAQPFASQDVVIGMLAEIPQGEQYSWELEQQSQLLEETTQQLLSEVEQRSQAEQALTAANQQIRALNASLQADNVDLEHHVQERTQDLEAAIAELKTTQTQLIQTEKMSSLGQMVAGIAHEVNNPINFIHGNVFYIRRYVEDLCRLITAYQQGFQTTPEIEALIEEIELDFLLEDIRKILNSVDMGTQRVRDIVAALRNFSRLDEAEVKAVDLHEGLNSTLLILDNRLKRSCTVHKHYGELPLVKCYPAQLNQVFTNIVVNAIDAMELAESETQEITITTQAIADHRVQIIFQDTGPGIPEEVKAKIFDPFFTTKPIGKGTGLGLGICYQIVQKHGGTIEVNSLPQQGTEFIVTLPLTLTVGVDGNTLN